MDISPGFKGLPRSLMVAVLMLLFPAMAADTAPGGAGALAQAATAPPKQARFVPTEKIKADTVVDFPVDI